MRKSRFSESQIVQILKSVEAGRTVKEVCRERGISDATCYNWKSKYGGMEASDIFTSSVFGQRVEPLVFRSVYCYQPDTSRAEPVISMLAEVVER